MSNQTNMISNDIMRAVMDYISENEKNKVPTKNFSKVGRALSLIRTLLETLAGQGNNDRLSFSVEYEQTSVCITITLPADWSFSKKTLKTWKDLLSLVDKMSHTAVPAGEDEMPAEDRLTFVIDNVFEKEEA